MVQIYVGFGKDIPVDLHENLFDRANKLLIHEIVDGHEAGSRASVEQPHEADIRLAQLFDLPDGYISVLHKGKQYYAQQLFRIIFRPACSLTPSFCKILFQVNMIQDFAERIYRIGNFYDF